MSGVIRSVGAVAAGALVAGCASYHYLVASAGLHETTVRGTTFEHLIVRREMSPVPVSILDVYLEGDGRPFVTTERVSADPTPRKPLALKLMLRDLHDAVYVGRPCYFGVGGEACSARYWTVARYAPEVVDSLAQAIESIRQDLGAQQLVLIGHSGGGALAVLVAARLETVTSVVTLAANLDTDAWTAAHAYTPLTASLNPADARLAPKVHQFHAVGDADTNVPPASVARFRQAAPQATWCTVPGCAHGDCWSDNWTRFIEVFRSGGDACEALQHH